MAGVARYAALCTLWPRDAARRVYPLPEVFVAAKKPSGPDGNLVASIEARIAESEAHTEGLQRLLAMVLHGKKAKQLGSKVQTPKQLMKWWNDWAEKLGKPKIEVVSKKRLRGFHARLKSGQWSVPTMNKRLQTLGRFALTKRWFNLDFFLCSDGNYAKFIEGNYSSDTVLEAVAESRAQRIEPTVEGVRIKDTRAQIKKMLNRGEQ